MNGRSEEKLIVVALRELEERVERLQHENDAIIECLLDCVRELNKLRKQPSEEAIEPYTSATMGLAEKTARLAIAPHLKGLTETQRENFCSGKLDPDSVWLGVSFGHFVTHHSE